MDNFFEFITLTVFSHIVVGCIVVVLLSVLVNGSRFNAATRHDMWIGCLALLIIMPLAVLTPFRPALDFSFEQEVSSEPVPAAESQDQVAPAVLALQTDFSASAPSILPENSVNDSVTSTGTSPDVEGISPLSLVGMLLVFSLLAGMGLRLFRFSRALIKMNSMFDAARKVNPELQERLDHIVNELELVELIQLRQSKDTQSPITGGWTLKWILFPEYLVEDESNQDTVGSILLHELAHIRRRDPEIAIVLGFVGAIFFWHPAVTFAIRKIKYERELACDDWVLAYLGADEMGNVRKYAENLVNLADRSSSRVFPGLAVGCVQASAGLKQRLKFLMDRGLDHSSKPRYALGAASTLSLLVLVMITSPIWPVLPINSDGDFNSRNGVLVSQGQSTGALNNTGLVSGSDIERRVLEIIDASLISTIPSPPTPVSSISSVDNLEIGALETDTELLIEAIDMNLGVESNLGFTIDIGPQSSPAETNGTNLPKEDPAPTDLFNILADQSASTSPYGDRPLEEILVTGKKTLRSVGFQLERAEQRLYDMYNDLNSNDDFDITCERRKQDGSPFSQQVCEPVFLDEYRQANLREVMDAQRGSAVGNFMERLRGTRVLTDRALRERASAEFESVQQEMLVLAAENPDFRARLVSLGELQTEFETMVEDAELDWFQGNGPLGLSGAVNRRAEAVPRNTSLGRSGPVHQVPTGVYPGRNTPVGGGNTPN